MPYTKEAKNMMLDLVCGMISHASLHVGRPTLPDTELSQGAYTRQPVSIVLPPDNGETRTDAVVRIEVPPETTISHVGFWTSSLGGTLLAWAPVPKKKFRGRGVFEISIAYFDLNLGSETE